MQPQQIEGQRAQTILVVESDESTRRILDLSLRHAGFAVKVASNAEEGGKRLADRPDLETGLQAQWRWASGRVAAR